VAALHNTMSSDSALRDFLASTVIVSENNGPNHPVSLIDYLMHHAKLTAPANARTREDDLAANKKNYGDRFIYKAIVEFVDLFKTLPSSPTHDNIEQLAAGIDAVLIPIIDHIERSQDKALSLRQAAAFAIEACADFGVPLSQKAQLYRSLPHIELT
jgi:hypothetical protein